MTYLPTPVRFVGALALGVFVDAVQELRRRQREAERAAENCAECHRRGVCCRWHWIERTE